MCYIADPWFGIIGGWHPPIPSGQTWTGTEIRINSVGEIEPGDDEYCIEYDNPYDYIVSDALLGK